MTKVTIEIEETFLEEFIKLLRKLKYKCKPGKEAFAFKEYLTGFLSLGGGGGWERGLEETLEQLEEETFPDSAERGWVVPVE